MREWLHNIKVAIKTVIDGLKVTLRYWLITYRTERGTFTEQFEYPEKPVPVAARYRGFHRFDLTTCIACDQCAKACPWTVFTLARSGSRMARALRSAALPLIIPSACFVHFV